MNQKKAKALRRGVGFHPAAIRQYEHDKPSQQIGRDLKGNPALVVVTGTIRSTGTRQQYQNAKRTPGLAARLVGAA